MFKDVLNTAPLLKINSLSGILDGVLNRSGNTDIRQVKLLATSNCGFKGPNSQFIKPAKTKSTPIFVNLCVWCVFSFMP